MSMETCKQDVCSYFHNIYLVLLSSGISLLTQYHIEIISGSTRRERDYKLSVCLNVPEMTMNKLDEHAFLKETERW